MPVWANTIPVFGRRRHAVALHVAECCAKHVHSHGAKNVVGVGIDVESEVTRCSPSRRRAVAKQAMICIKRMDVMIVGWVLGYTVNIVDSGFAGSSKRNKRDDS